MMRFELALDRLYYDTSCANCQWLPIRDSVTNNLFVATHKFSRPRLATSPAGSVSAPSFSSQDSKTSQILNIILHNIFKICLAADQGLEPQYHPPEGCVLPLDESAIRK